MKAIVRLVHPHGEPPHWLVVPVPQTDAEFAERDRLPVTIRFEADPRNIAAMSQDANDWVVREFCHTPRSLSPSNVHRA